MGWSFSGWPGVGGILWRDLRANSGFGGILSPNLGLFFSVGWGLDTLLPLGAVPGSQGSLGVGHSISIFKALREMGARSGSRGLHPLIITRELKD